MNSIYTARLPTKSLEITTLDRDAALAHAVDEIFTRPWKLGCSPTVVGEFVEALKEAARRSAPTRPAADRSFPLGFSDLMLSSSVDAAQTVLPSLSSMTWA